MVEKKYINAQQLQEDSFALAAKILESGFHPDFIVGIWRGGTPVGIAVQEFLDYFGIKTDHIAIRTSAYEGINQRGKEIRIHGLGYIVERANEEDRLLLVDDVFDSGLSMQAVVQELRKKARKNAPSRIRIATPYFKPKNNLADLTPDYYLYETDKWLIFPHELEGLSRDEIYENKPCLKSIMEGIQEP
jgi:hypoxanthine phosphoribosyltransferase